MTVREADPSDINDWVRMRAELWPGSIRVHEADVIRYFHEPDERMRTFVAEDEAGRLVGFLELDQRKYAAGCDSSPVPFIEGWYVDPPFRLQGVGRALFRAAEDWAIAHGFGEIASDADITNAVGIAAHEALGYQEVERVVCFRRSLRDA
jgi:aminoglycoside 6'-N-acetyltransferase I